MKKNYALLLLLVLTSLNSNAQSECGFVAENQTLTLTAPAGMVFTSIDFASYGTPTGSCPGTDFAISGCHATTSQSAVEAVALNNNSFSIDATNTVFGDPCNGTGKFLAVKATYETLSNATFSNGTSVSIYPNPSNDIVKIDFSKFEKGANLEIYDYKGELIQSKKLNIQSNLLDIRTLMTGIYIFKISSQEETLIKKVIKN